MGTGAGFSDVTEASDTLQTLPKATAPAAGAFRTGGKGAENISQIQNANYYVTKDSHNLIDR